MKPHNGFTTVTITDRAHVALRGFHQLLLRKGLDQLPKTILCPESGITFSEAIEALATLGTKELRRKRKRN